MLNIYAGFNQVKRFGKNSDIKYNKKGVGKSETKLMSIWASGGFREK